MAPLLTDFHNVSAERKKIKQERLETMILLNCFNGISLAVKKPRVCFLVCEIHTYSCDTIT